METPKVNLFNYKLIRIGFEEQGISEIEKSNIKLV
jgi:hypothetical protein